MRRYPGLIGRRVFYGWWIVVLGCLVNFVGQGVLYHSLTVFFLPLKRDLEVSSAAISLLYGAARLEGGVEGPAIGYLIDRFGSRVMIIAGATLAGVGLILLSRVHSFLAFFLIYTLIVSVGNSAGFYHPVTAAVNRWFIRRRAATFGITTAAGSFGGIIMAPLLSYLILNFGWRAGAVAGGLIILAVALPAALPMLRSPEVRGLYPDGRPPAFSAGGSSTPIPAEVNFTVKQALRTSNYWLLASTITLRILVTVSLSIHFVPILVWRGVDEAAAAYMVSLLAFSTITATLVMGWAGDRWSKSLICSAGMVIAVMGMVGLMLSQATAALYAFSIGLGIANGANALNWALIGDFFGRHSYATLRGVMAVGYGISTFLSPIYAGWVFDTTGSYAIVLISFSAILLVVAFLFAVLRRPPPPIMPASG